MRLVRLELFDLLSIVPEVFRPNDKMSLPLAIGIE